jgi:hypothetical protein
MTDFAQNLKMTPWVDPIVEELHQIRARLLEKYNGDIRAYSKAATERALALGFKFAPVDSQGQLIR